MRLVSPPSAAKERTRRGAYGVDLAVWPSPSSCRCCGPWWRGMATTARLSCRRHHHIPFLPRPLPPPSFFSSLGCHRRHLPSPRLAATATPSSSPDPASGSRIYKCTLRDSTGRGGSPARRHSPGCGASRGSTSPTPLHPRCKL